MSGDVTLMYFVRNFLLYLIFWSVGWGSFQSSTRAVTSLNVMWNASTDTNVLGYKVYYGTASQQYSNVVVAGNSTNTLIAGIKPGKTYYFAATSYNAAGWESAYSPELVYTVPVVNPPLAAPQASSSGFNFSVNSTANSQYVIIASTNLVNWVALTTNTAPFVFTDTNASQYSHRYYQAVLLSMYVPQTAPTQPVISPALTSPVNGPGGFSFTVSKTAGSPYVIVASTDLINWVSIGTNTAPFTFTDTNSSKYSKRFYKAILQSAYVPQILNLAGATPALGSYGYSAGGFGFTLTGTANAQYVVLASTNLVNWMPILTNSAPFIFTDPTAKQYNQRFYKAVPLY